MRRYLIYSLISYALISLLFGQTEIKDKKSELSEIKTKLSDTRKELKDLQKKEASSLARLETLDQERSLLNRLISALQLQENEYRGSLEHTELEIKTTETVIEKKKDDLVSRINRIYRQTRFHELEIYLSGRTIPEVLSAAHYLKYIADDDRRTFEEFKKLRKTYLYQKENYVTLLKELKETEQERLTELAALKEQKKREQNLLDSVRNETKEKKEIEKDLKQAQRRLEDLIVSLEKKRQASTGQTHPFEINKGSIPWPCKGKVINSYGKIRHPKYNTVTKNNGIDIKASVGSDVSAVGSGRVVYADRFLGYGNVVLIDHEDGYYTLYGHLSEILVQVNDKINTGAKIGQIGDIGALGESMLHFELRKKGKPVDPLTYLK